MALILVDFGLHPPRRLPIGEVKRTGVAMTNLVWGLTATLAGVILGVILRGLGPDPARLAPIDRRSRRLLRLAAGWILSITLVGLGLAVAPSTPFWLGGTVMAAGYAALAGVVSRRVILGERTRELDARFEEIVAPLRDEMPT